ncbi:MAG: hypothetical protein IJZ66_09225, partial [Oscillibacter sp.]|nr:hypothetical protein [Oscillibacter sp.]
AKKVSRCALAPQKGRKKAGGFPKSGKPPKHRLFCHAKNLKKIMTNEKICAMMPCVRQARGM